MRLVAVPPAQVGAVWRRVGPWIAAACERPGCLLTPELLLGICTRQEGQLIVILDWANRSVAAGVTQVRDYESGKRTCWVLCIGGSGARNWRWTLREIEAGARRNGCHRIEFVGRNGWRRILPDYAATPCEAGTHYTKNL